jgi:hypothetical protein
MGAHLARAARTPGSTLIASDEKHPTKDITGESISA